MPSGYLVTAGLPYSNRRLHAGYIGGAYLRAGIYVRYLRATGRDVRFICGSDDNGVAIEISALPSRKTPQEIATHFHESQKCDFAGLASDPTGGTPVPYPKCRTAGARRRCHTGGGRSASHGAVRATSRRAGPGLSLRGLACTFVIGGYALDEPRNQRRSSCSDRGRARLRARRIAAA